MPSFPATDRLARHADLPGDLLRSEPRGDAQSLTHLGRGQAPPEENAVRKCGRHRHGSTVVRIVG
jgi:hypothetical protein